MMKTGKVSLLGIFGWYNLGNNCTLQAFLHNTRRYLPEAEITCICPNPANVIEEHRILAMPINILRRQENSKEPKRQSKINQILSRLIAEPSSWIKAYKHLRETDMLVMTGTGMLDDGGIGPLRLPYDLFRWTLIAKFCGTKVYFTSVGAGPIFHPLSRWFIKRALALATYRSYRNTFSKDYLQQIGCNVRDDPIYPDLAFSLPEKMFEVSDPNRHEQPVVGIGLMSKFYTLPMNGETIYPAYISEIVNFTSWLFTQGYRVRLLVGDTYDDRRAVEDVQAGIKHQGARCDARQLIIESICSNEDLIRQLAATDIVIATRFHNIIMALMLEKPVISISYHPKNDALLTEVGLGELCQPIEHIDGERLIEQFNVIVENFDSIKGQIKLKIDRFRQELDQQYDLIFDLP